MKEPIRVLQVFGGTTLSGAESRIMDIYRNIDRTKVQFDFMVHNHSEDYFNTEIRQLGGNIYRVPRFRLFNLFQYRKAWKQFFCVHSEYQAVHAHMTSTASLYLPIAKRSGVPMTIAHARSAGTDPGLKGILTKVLRKSLADKTDFCLACSKIAGIAVFGEKEMESGNVQIIPNAIEVDKYVYQEESRNSIREEYGLEHKFVIGHVGRFCYAKNHAFLLDIFAEVSRQREEAMLFLIGDGPLMEAVREKAKRLGIMDRVVLAGSHANIRDYYQAMDYLVFPSHFEGLPGAVVEAQAAGLRCLISAAVTDEVRITELVAVKSLQETAEEWTEEVLQNQQYERSNVSQELKNKGFDVKSQVGKLEKFYSGKSEKVL